MKRPLVCLIAVLVAGCVISNSNAQAPSPTVAWELSEGVQSPESAYFDQDSGSLFISQIGDGGATGKDQDGYISRLTPEGKVVAIKWITGLDSPKGLRSHQGRLWVSDIDRLVEIDIAEGKIVRRIPMPGSGFLNDVACDAGGTVYVSETMGNKIYRLRNGQVEVFAEGEELEYPNGLLIAGDKLVVAAWGKPNEDFSTKVPGRLFSLDLKTGKKSLITPEPFGNLDGLEAVAEGRYLVSDWMAGKIYYVTSDRSRQVLQLPKGAADIGWIAGQRLLVVPQMVENKVTAYEMRRPARTQ
jgi:sugar lactone lactonase YvrE